MFGVQGEKLISSTQTFSDNRIVVDGVFEEFELMLGDETLRLTAIPNPVEHGSRQEAVLHAKSYRKGTEPDRSQAVAVIGTTSA